MKNLLIVTCIFCISIAHAFAQDELKIELKDAPKPDIYIDGKKYDYEIFNLLDQSKIESVNVIKDEQAMKEYNAPNGVIIIKTKKASNQIVIENDHETKIVIKGSKDGDKDPVFIIDGKVSDRKTLSKLSPDDIESIDVFKGQKAIDEHNAPNGVIIVKTKK